MEKLTDNQKEFLLEYFFKNEKYPGWKGIATTLLDKGECVVAGTKCIWNGGIGNFIETENAEGFYDCLSYKFDLNYFLTSEWFKEIQNHVIDLNVKDYNELGKTITDLQRLKAE